MCANFNKAFNNKAFNKKDISVPDSILKQLEKDLPNGFKYKSLKDGTCMVVPDDINNIIKKEAFIIPDELEDKNIDEILQYSYSSQEPLKFKNNIPLEGDELKVQDMVKFPFKAQEISLGELILSPSPFKEFTITLECEEVKKDITVKRQPSKDVNKIILKRIDSNDLEFTYIINLSNSKIDFNINVNFEYCSSVEKLLDNLKLYKAFGEGKLKMAGINMVDKSIKFKTNVNKDAINEMIIFYEKLLKISKLINVEIKPSESIDSSDIYSVEELYKTLIDNQPYKEYINIDKLNITTIKVLDKDLLLNREGFAFHSLYDCEWNILGSNIVLPSIIVMYNIIVTDVKELSSTKDIDYELHITNEKGKKIYKSCMHFKDNETRDNYMKSSDNIIETLKDTEEINI